MNARRSCAGFSLLELLLATALGVLMTAAIIGLFVSNTRGYALVGGQARLQESARLAVHFLTRSARSAGYFGCGHGGELADGLGGDWRTDPLWDISSPVTGADDVTDASQVAGWGLGNRRIKPGSDVVVFRRIDGLGHDLAQPFDASRDLVIASTFRAKSGERAVLSGCGRLGVLAVDGIARSSGLVTLADKVDVDALAPPLVGYGALPGPAATVVAPVLTEVYFVAESRFVNNRGAESWSLWRRTGRADEVVSGIDDLQVLYAIDASLHDADPTPQRYVPAGDIGAAAVRAVRIVVTASSVDAVTDADEPLSRTVSQTVALRNHGVPI